MKSLHEDTPQPFYKLMNGSTVRSGVGGTLAGIAERGSRLDVPGPTGGSYINNGSKAEPRWERITRDADKGVRA